MCIFERTATTMNVLDRINSLVFFIYIPVRLTSVCVLVVNTADI